MNFCSQCGAKVVFRLPDGDNLSLFICDNCSTIHYQNPKLVVGCIPEWEDKILLCKRAIEPGYGLWTFPAGFMENNETVAAGAMRETLEEANARVEVGQLFSFISLPHISQVYVLFRAKLLDLDFSAGPESLEVKLFSEDQIPWNHLAFRTMHYTLENYYGDRRKGKFELHTGVIGSPTNNSM